MSVLLKSFFSLLILRIHAIHIGMFYSFDTTRLISALLGISTSEDCSSRETVIAGGVLPLI